MTNMDNNKPKNLTVYSDERYALGMEDGRPYLTAGGRKLTLSCHPYEPCLYITDEDGRLTAVHNAFDPYSVVETFAEGGTVTSITGREYGAKDFCRMVEYAAGMVDVQIDYAERVLGPVGEEKAPLKERVERRSNDVLGPLPEYERIIENDPFFDIISRYPDCVVDYCLVGDLQACKGLDAHRTALAWACRKLFIDIDGEVIWDYELGKAAAREISAVELFAPVEKGAMNYRKAFLLPPYPNDYTDADFDKVNAALFPNGTDKIEVLKWSTGWSEYFDDGNEWWGTLCLTVYDKSLDRIAVILASATD